MMAGEGLGGRGGGGGGVAPPQPLNQVQGTIWPLYYKPAAYNEKAGNVLFDQKLSALPGVLDPADCMLKETANVLSDYLQRNLSANFEDKKESRVGCAFFLCLQKIHKIRKCRIMSLSYVRPIDKYQWIKKNEAMGIKIQRRCCGLTCQLASFSGQCGQLPYSLAIIYTRLKPAEACKVHIVVQYKQPTSSSASPTASTLIYTSIISDIM